MTGRNRPGSTPRMWGTQHSEPPTYAQQRFIPTHVGNTAWGTATISGSPVHPHACGEHHDPKPGSHGTTGSSPRMWGTPLRAEGHRHEGRFIPTHVGNTDWPAGMVADFHGSSPRMWGTQDASVFDGLFYRFIPTHVGNTGSWTTKAGSTSVHPHACGEHVPAVTLALPCAGSSPRTWGTRQRDAVRNEVDRFIPTHVGNTLRPATPAMLQPVHPHARGEHLPSTAIEDH
ncbi:hypothetical protein Q058_03151 [Pseudomonas aeruginosa BL04]|nr:hypothetical protein Q058_03151 [Pseudomonas aeruginosa BL04]